jgi:hypothetical protein
MYPKMYSYTLVTLKKEHGLRVLKNRMHRRIFGPKREEVRECQRKLHNEMCNFYLLP